MSTGINIDKSIKVVDETTPITDSASQLTFTGAGVTATGSGGNVTINIPGGSTGSVTNVTGVSPIASSGGNTPAISISDAAADDTTKGAATFTANDFNSASGVISLDYTNGQKASGSQDGFLSSANWTTFNNKQNTITGGASTITTSNLSPSFALQSNASGKVEVSTVTSTELGYVSGVTSSIQTQLNSKQNALVNPVTGTGASGQVSFWSGTDTQSGSNNLFWDNTNGRLGIGTSTPDSPLNITRPVSASSGVARTVNVASTLTATANNDTLVAFDINPTFTNGAFTGVGNLGLRNQGWLQSTSGIIINNVGGLAWSPSGTPSNGLVIGLGGVYYNGSGAGFTHTFRTANNNVLGNRLVISDSTVQVLNTNLLVNTTSDAGFKLDVNGTARVQGNLTVTGNSVILPASTGVYGSSSVSGVHNSGGSAGYVALGFNSDFTNRIGLYLFQNSNNPQFVFGRATLVQPTNIKFEITGSQTAPALGTLAVGTSISNTLVASANNQTLVGLDVTPTFTTGAFTGITNTALRVTGDVLFGSNFIWNNTNGNLALGGTASSTDRLYVKATTTSASDFAIKVQDSNAATNLFTINNAGSLVMRNRSFTGEFTLGFTANNTLTFGLTAIGAFMTVGTTTPTNVVTFGVQQIQANSRGAQFASTLDANTPNAVTINGIPSLTSGTTPLNSLLINPAINNTGTYVGTVRGLYYNPTLTSLTGTTHRAIETTSGDVIFNSTSGNVAIGGTSFGTSANRVLAVYNGTAPASSPLDSFQMYSADIPSTSTAAPHFRNENGNIIKLYQETAVTTAQGIANALTNLGVLATSTIPQSGYTLIFGHNTFTYSANTSYDIGSLTYDVPSSSTSNAISRRFKVPKTGIVRKVSIMTTSSSGTIVSASPSPTIQLFNFTTSTATTITTTNLYYDASPPFARNDVFSINATVTELDEIAIRSIIGNVTTPPQSIRMMITLWIEET